MALGLDQGRGPRGPSLTPRTSRGQTSALGFEGIALQHTPGLGCGHVYGGGACHGLLIGCLIGCGAGT